MDEIVKNTEDMNNTEEHSNSLPKKAKNRREAILLLIKKVGFRNTRNRTKGLAKTYEVSDRTIRSDFKWIRDHITPEDIKEIKITVRVAIDTSIDTALEQFVNQPTIENSKSLMQIAKGYREEIEAWGEKEKVADKHQVEGIGEGVKINVNVSDEIKELFEKKD